MLTFAPIIFDSFPNTCCRLYHIWPLSVKEDALCEFFIRLPFYIFAIYIPDTPRYRPNLDEKLMQVGKPIFGVVLHVPGMELSIPR